MGVIRSKEDVSEQLGTNQICGVFPQMKNSSIYFNGQNNILFCEEGVQLSDTFLLFNGNHSVIYLGKNKHEYKLGVTVYHHSVFHMGRDNYINGKMNIILSEQKHCFIGDNGLYSGGIWMRNADPHLIYNCTEGKRINPTKSIYIGDHVWIGQSAMILKGTQIDSGSIVGAMSVAAGKKILHNTSWAGNPVRQVASDIFWDGACVHAWSDKQTEDSLDYGRFVDNYRKGCDKEAFVFHYDAQESIGYDELEQTFSSKITPEEKVAYLKKLHSKVRKNRFVHE